MMLPTEFSGSGYQGVTVIVLGASGFIGRWVARYLSQQQANLHLVVRDAATAGPMMADYEIRGNVIELDLLDADRLGAVFRQVQPAITFNLAGYGVDRSERDAGVAEQINTHLLDWLCDAVAPIRSVGWAGQEIVHVGSALEYGEIGGNLAEDSACNPTTLYGRTKLAGTQALARCCAARGIKGLTARMFTVYGPGEHNTRLLPALLDAATSGRPLNLTAGLQQRDFTYVEDVAAGLLRLGLSNAAPGEVINLATGQLTTVRRFAETAAHVLGIAAGNLRFGVVPTRVEEMQHAPVAITRLRHRIGWTPPTSVEAGIRKAIEFLR